MSKQHRVQSGGSSGAEQEAAALTREPLEQQVSNEYLAALLEIAGEQAKIDEQTTLLSLVEGRFDIAEDGGEDGRYWFAEDGDRKTQDLDLPGLRPQHADEGHQYKDFEKGVAFVKGAGDEHEVDPNDAAQGSLGNCYLIAGMVSVARANPDAIRDLIVDNGDGTFDVTLYIRRNRFSDPEKVVTTIDAQLPVKNGTPLYAKTADKADDGGVELWPALLEKAVAQQKGSYDLISGGNIARGFEFHGATELFTGEKEGYIATKGMSEDDALLHIAIALDDRKPVTCDTYDMTNDEAMSRESTKVNVYGNHAYSPSEVDLGGRTISLTNPWGSQHVTELPVKDFLRYYRAIRIGE